MKPGDVHYVVAAKDVYRALTGDMGTDSPQARKWLRNESVKVLFLPDPVDRLAIAVEQP